MGMLESLTMTQLRLLCRLKKLRNYSKLTKSDLVVVVERTVAATKIKRFLRRRWIDDGLCPITMDEVHYPCFVFMPKELVVDDNNKFRPIMIYYNLCDLIQYLNTSGDFRDPKTREQYSDKFLKSLDAYARKVGIKARSVYKASKNCNLYKKKKECEEDILILERCLDEVISSMRVLMEFPQDCCPSLTLKSFHFPTYHRYFRSLMTKSMESAKYVMVGTVSVITGPKQNPTKDPNGVKDLILQFILTLESTYFYL